MAFVNVAPRRNRDSSDKHSPNIIAVALLAAPILLGLVPTLNNNNPYPVILGAMVGVSCAVAAIAQQWERAWCSAREVTPEGLGCSGSCRSSIG